MVYQVSADYANNHFAKIIQKAQKDPEGVVITQGDRKFVLIEESNINNLQEAAASQQLSDLFKNVTSLKQEYQAQKTINLKEIFKQENN